MDYCPYGLETWVISTEERNHVYPFAAGVPLRKIKDNIQKNVHFS